MSTLVSLLNNNRILIPVLIIICTVIVILNNLFGAVVNVVVFGLILSVLVFYISNKYPRYNVVLLLATAFTIPFLIKALRLYTIPIGTANEALCLIILFTLAINKRLAGIKTLPGILIVIWIAFQCVELINPNAASREAGLWAIRSVIPMICVFFITYSSVESKRDVYIVIAGWLILALLAGLYGLYQELIGLPSYDFRWASYDEKRYNLLFTWGRLRKFSFFFSPSEFGMLMAISGVAAFIVFFFVQKRHIQVLSAITAIICFWSMIYTGSRTSMVMLPIGFVIFAVLTLHKKVLIAVGCVIIIGAVLVLKPGSNQALYVMSTAFSGSEDPSMNVRIQNQKTIQGYIRSQPLGFGLGSTGDLGMKYSPHTFVGSFPPDSEYVKIGIETGWFGLLLWCTIQASIFAYCVHIYFRIKDPDWRLIQTFVIVVFFMIVVAQYPQEFFRSQPLTILFSTMLGFAAKSDFKTRSKSMRSIEQ
jgi:hypothetical protein